MADPLLASCASPLERPFGRLTMDVNPVLAFCFGGFAGDRSILPTPSLGGGTVSKAASQRGPGVTKSLAQPPQYVSQDMVVVVNSPIAFPATPVQNGFHVDCGVNFK
jgi:hypothetical protein